MKKKVADLIKILGITVNEIVIEVEFGEYTINSLEWISETDTIILHIWFKVEGDKLEYEYDADFDTLSEEDQKKLYNILSKYCMN